MNNIFTKSERFKSEYSCAVVRVGELTPIEGSDFLAKTLVFGTQIVVRKDLVKEGDIMLYAANETQLNEKFLSVNNLFEIGERDRNSNHEEINKIMAEYEPTKAAVTVLKDKIKSIKSKSSLIAKDIDKTNKKIAKLTTSSSNNEEILVKISELQSANQRKVEMLEKLNAESAKLVEEKNKLIENSQHIIDKAKELCGFFNKYGRVKLITLKGEPSFGFLFAPESLFAFDPSITKEDVENYVGEEFDTVNGELFVKAYVPYVKEPTPRNNMKRAQKRVKKFDRLVEGEFTFHYDTTQLQKSMDRIKPTDVVDITPKVHGTSAIFGNLIVKNPIKLPFFQRMYNKLIDISGLFKSMRIKDYELVYGPIFSSRKVIKNEYINENTNNGYYESDIWSEYGNFLYPYLDKGMTVYGEIVGYISNSQKMIQKNYDYGCNEGENKIMFYRITTNGENGRKIEWEIPQIKEWTEKLIDKMLANNDENYHRIMPIPILYHGTLGDLYDGIDETEHWHENVLEAMKNDKDNFKMEELEPLCKFHEVPREGIVLRIEKDPIKEAFKLKCTRFLGDESKLMDELAKGGEEVDIEMMEAYS